MSSHDEAAGRIEARENRVPHLIYLLSKSSYFTRGRAGRVTHALGVAEGFAANGWTVDLVTGPGEEDYRADLRDDVRWHEVPSAGFRGPSIWRELRWRLAAFRSTIDRLVGSDLFIFRYAITQPLMLLRLARAARRQGVASVVEVNSLAYHRSSRLPDFLRSLILRIESHLVSRFDLVYVVSRRVKEHLIAGGCTSEIVVLPNASHPRSPAPAARPSTRESTRTGRPGSRIVYMGTLQPYYDFEFLLEGFDRLAETMNAVSLEIYGNGPMLDEMRAAARHRPEVHVHGRYSHDRMSDLVDRDTDVLVLPLPRRRVAWNPRWPPEGGIGSATKLFEYLSMGVCVVASNVGQTTRILSHGETGYLYEADDLDSFVAVVEHALAHPGERLEIGERGRREFLASHTWEIRMRELISAVGEPLDSSAATG